MTQGDSVFVDHSNVEVGHQDQDSLVLVSASDTNVMETSAIAQGEASGLVDAIVPHLGVRE